MQAGFGITRCGLEDVLSQMYMGQLGIRNNPAVKEARRSDEITWAESYIMSVLKDKDREIFMKYIENVEDESGDREEEMFKRGFKLGAKIAIAMME